jgi:hypothetical protein
LRELGLVGLAVVEENVSIGVEPGVGISEGDATGEVSFGVGV